MKLTTQRLKKIIKEELGKVMAEDSTYTAPSIEKYDQAKEHVKQAMLKDAKEEGMREYEDHETYNSYKEGEKTDPNGPYRGDPHPLYKAYMAGVQEMEAHKAKRG